MIKKEIRMKSQCNTCFCIDYCIPIANVKRLSVCKLCLMRNSNFKQCTKCKEFYNAKLGPCPCDQPEIGLQRFDYKASCLVKRLHKGDNSPSIGLEIEVEIDINKALNAMSAAGLLPAAPISFSNNKTIETLLANISRPWFYYKRDGSINSGVEIVTRPMTYKYLMANKNEIFGTIESFEKFGLYSRPSTTCGLHIHIGKNSFTSLTIYKLLKIINSNIPLITSFSGRVLSDMLTWARPIRSNDMKHMSIYKTNERHHIISLPNPETVEFRFFKGTLRTSEIIAAIQLSLVLKEISGMVSIKDSINDEFIFNYISNSEYEELKKQSNVLSNMHKIKPEIKNVYNNIFTN